MTKKLTEQAEAAGIFSFYDKLRYLTDEGLYGNYILASYTPQEIETFMCPERDKLFNYSGLENVIIKDIVRNVFRDCPSSRYARKTEQTAMGKKFYDILSRLEVTMATPTPANDSCRTYADSKVWPERSAAVAVDQLGMRQGAVAVYLDVWHKDLPEMTG